MAVKQAAKGTPAPKKDALEKKATTALSTEVVDLEQFAGEGGENVGSQDLAIPRISILQSGSPQVKKSEGQYIKGAEEGDFFNNVDNAVLAKGEDSLVVVFACYDSKFIEWVPKNKGGGFCGTHKTDSGILAKTRKDADGRDLLPNGHEIVLTGEFHCIVWAEGAEPRAAAISFAKTQFKKGKLVNSTLKMLQEPSKKNPGRKFNPPYYASYFHVTSVPESNDKGNWMGWKIERKGYLVDPSTGEELIERGRELFDMAQALRAGVAAGTVKVADPVDDATAGGGGGNPEDGGTL